MLCRVRKTLCTSHLYYSSYVDASYAAKLGLSYYLHHRAITDRTREGPSHTMSAEEQGTVIVGAGIVGCATAFYLSESKLQDPRKIFLIEQSEELFSSASGKAGGFLAADCMNLISRPMMISLTLGCD